ncbi:hypothetical protein CK203_091843 [Vitis vinifera]|uniref:Reverse transcriptase domain-containing protein n=1 Tax=Vitis vinifera TaxID=29760 RepID=A0A438BLZ9_VITVI|nr:hypothetical protein CK203_091843 [Vitis vinifera]
MSLMTLYFSDEVDEHGIFAEIGDMVDGVVLHDEYIDEMLVMSMSKTDGIGQPELASPFDFFGVSTIEVKEEIQKQLSVRFLSLVEYPEWLANVVFVPKKDGKVQSDSDDSRGHGKKSFIIEWGTYYYRVMSFGLKNVGATYQRAMITLFHDMMHWDVEVYVDDMIVKSQDRAYHLATLERFFERINGSD